LEPLPETDLPREVQPLVGALNDLLSRLSHTLGAQRAFVADAAHELRTPLTAVHLQAQLAERATTDAERAAAPGELKGGLERTTQAASCSPCAIAARALRSRTASACSTASIAAATPAASAAAVSDWRSSSKSPSATVPTSSLGPGSTAAALA